MYGRLMKVRLGPAEMSLFKQMAIYQRDLDTSFYNWSSVVIIIGSEYVNLEESQ